MNLHKQFIDELGKNRITRVGDVIVFLGVVNIQDNNIMNLGTNLNTVEQIFYTVDYLIENNFVTQRGGGSSDVPDFNPQSFFGKDGLVLTVRRINTMPHYLKEYWSKTLCVRPAYFRFIKNGYRTDEEREKSRNYWLPIIVAVLTAFLTAFFGYLFSICK